LKHKFFALLFNEIIGRSIKYLTDFGYHKIKIIFIKDDFMLTRFPIS